MSEAIDYLQADNIQIPGQKYALISVVSPQGKQKNDMCGVKIRGVFDDMESAKMHAKKLQKDDPIFDVYLVELYKWLPIPPDNTHIESQEYQDEVLNKLVQGHVDEQARAREFFNHRNLEVMKGNVDPIAESIEEGDSNVAEGSSSKSLVADSSSSKSLVADSSSSNDV